jgi:hypothetical protein
MACIYGPFCIVTNTTGQLSVGLIFDVTWRETKFIRKYMWWAHVFSLVVPITVLSSTVDKCLRLKYTQLILLVLCE